MGTVAEADFKFYAGIKEGYKKEKNRLVADRERVGLVKKRGIFYQSCIGKIESEEWRDHMSLLEAIGMGLIQGITEFLPVSSSGHLVIFQNVFHLDPEGSLLFLVLLHVGTILVVLVSFRKDIQKILAEVLGMCRDILENSKIFFYNKKQDEAKRYKKIVHNNYRKFAILLFITTIFTGLVGYASRELVLFSKTTLTIPAICFFITGILLLVSDLGENGHKIPKDVGYGNGVVLGIMQGIAVLPGLSSLGLVLSVCLLSGFQRKFAVKYAFLASIPPIFGALILELSKTDGSRVNSMVGMYLLGTAVACVTGFVLIRFALNFLRKKKFRVFAYYCFVMGVLSIAAHFATK